MDFNIDLTEDEKKMNELEKENIVDFEMGKTYVEENIYDLVPDEEIEEE